MFPLNSDAKMTQIGEQKFIRVQEIVSSPQNFQEGGPTDPKLNVPPPHHAPSVCQSSPHSLFTLVGLRYGRVQSRQTGSNRYTTRLFISLI